MCLMWLQGTNKLSGIYLLRLIITSLREHVKLSLNIHKLILDMHSMIKHETIHMQLTSPFVKMCHQYIAKVGQFKPKSIFCSKVQ